MQKNLTDRTLKALKPAAKKQRYEVYDTTLPAFAARIDDQGKISFTLMKRINGKMRRWTIGRYLAGANNVKPVLGGILSLAQARELARDVINGAARGIDLRDQHKARELEQAKREANTFGSICESFLRRHVSKNRSAAETRRVFNMYVLPTWGARPIESITRRDVAELLDLIEDGKLKAPTGEALGGPVMADRVLAAVRKLFNWHAARDETFISPVVRGMARTKPKERARTRTLTDDEIRSLWPVLDQLGTFGALTKVLFLTAQRRDEVAHMRRSEIDSGIWTIPAERYKTKKANAVPLSPAALAVIEAQPVFHGCDLVFTTNGKTPFSGYSKGKRKLDGMLLKDLPRWTLHDIRRTAKTLMARAGVRPDVSERVLGHVIGGVEGVYDQHSYLPEKMDALERLAAMIGRIVNPPEGDNVVLLHSAV